jgi:hypothetical protein
MNTNYQRLLRVSACATVCGLLLACGGGGSTVAPNTGVAVTAPVAASISGIVTTTVVTTTTTGSTTSTTTVTPTLGLSGVTIAPLGSPRILLADAATLTRLTSSLNNNATSAARFKSIVDGQMAGAAYYGFEPWYAALMSKVTRTADYCQYAVTQTDNAVKAEELLIAANQRAHVADDSYLEVGPIVGNLAIVYDWCRPQMTDAQRTRWARYGNQAVWNVWNFEQARWGNTVYPWTGWSIDNPSNNYYYSFLRATMLLGLATYGESPQAVGWITKFRTEKIDAQLIPLFNRELQGGGSREGTGYGTAMKGLFDLYYWWEKSTGQRIADNTPHTLASLDKFMHDVMPTLDRIAPTGDHARDSTAVLFDYHREYLLILARLYASDAMAGVAKTLLAQSTVPTMAYTFEAWVDYLYDLGDITAQPLTRLPTARWSSGTGQWSMRSGWTPDAAYANLICGPYTESHAHRDQGSFVFFKGAWLAFDANINSHSGLSQDESAHNMVRIQKNGIDLTQSYGNSCTMQALADTPVYSYGLANITPMYAGQPELVKQEREFLLIKPATLVVFDRVQTSGTGVQRVWSLNLPSAPTINGDSFSMSNGGHTMTVARLAPNGLTSRSIAWPTVNADINTGWRVDAADATGNSSAFLHVMGADRAFSAATRSDATGKTGAQITLANGNIATVRFSTTGTGGDIEIRAGSQVLFTGVLPTIVQAPPRWAN